MPDHQHVFDEADRAVRTDERFFDRHRDRSYRVRQSSLAEVQANGAVYGSDEAFCPPGYRWFTLVKQIEPGVRLRHFVRALAGSETDMSDAEAKRVWDTFAQPGSHVARVEHQMRAAIVKARGGA